MRSRALLGDPAGALEAAAALGTRLAEIGAAPGADIRALADRIRRELR